MLYSLASVVVKCNALCSVKLGWLSVAMNKCGKMQKMPRPCTSVYSIIVTILVKTESQFPNISTNLKFNNDVQLVQSQQ